MNTIDLASLSNVTGGTAVNASNFTERAQALKAAADANPHPTAAQLAQGKNELCNNLYPYAKSGQPIDGLLGSFARSGVLSAGAKYCK